MPCWTRFFYDILYSTKEYKKVRLEFYRPEFYEWEQQELGGVRTEAVTA